MDPISQAISSLRVGRGTVRRFRQSGQWGLRYAGLTGSGFHVVVHGTGWLVTADGEPVELRAGSIVLITSGADHGLSATPAPLNTLPQVVLGLDPPDPGPADFEFLCGAYRLARGPVHPYLASMPDPVVVAPDEDRHPDPRSILELFGADELAAQPGADVTRPALLDLVLVHAMRRWLAEQPAAGRPLLSDPAIVTALHKMHASPRARWTVPSLSREVGLSPSVFTKRFTMVVGKPPMTYFTGWRLGQAARLLRETDASLATIARQIGYATEFAFGAAFRREYGVPPGRFRHAVRLDDVPSPAHHE